MWLLSAASPQASAYGVNRSGEVGKHAEIECLAYFQTVPSPSIEYSAAVYRFDSLKL